MTTKEVSEDWYGWTVEQQKELEQCRAENKKLRLEVTTLEELAVRNTARIERLQELLQDVEGTLLAYWTEIPEVELQRLREAIRSVDV